MRMKLLTLGILLLICLVNGIVVLRIYNSETRIVPVTKENLKTNREELKWDYEGGPYPSYIP